MSVVALPYLTHRYRAHMLVVRGFLIRLPSSPRSGPRALALLLTTAARTAALRVFRSVPKLPLVQTSANPHDPCSPPCSMVYCGRAVLLRFLEVRKCAVRVLTPYFEGDFSLLLLLLLLLFWGGRVQ